MPTVDLPANGWRPRKHQRALWGYLEGGGLRALEIAHRRWGKDEVALHRSCIALHERVGNVWHCLPEFAQARKAIWTSVNPHTGQRRIDEAFPVELRASTNEQEMFIRFLNGSTWQVIGSDNYDRLVGASVAGVVFSEWALANPAAWAYIAPILAENNGWALFITTPRGRNHAHKMLETVQKLPHWFHEVSGVRETGAVSLETIEEQRGEYRALYGIDAGDALIDQEYWCSFEAAILGAYWGREMLQAERDGRVATVDIEPSIPVHTAWDLGVGDSTALWCFQATYEGPRIVDYYEASGYAVDHYVDWLTQRGYHGHDYVPHDARVREWTSSGPDGKAKTRIETMIELKRDPRLVSGHKLDDGINAARRLLPKCVWDAKRCEQGLERLRQYRREWDDDAKTFRDRPRHDWTSHGADAWRYLAMAWEELAIPVKPADKPVRGIADATWDQVMLLNQRRGGSGVRV